MKTLTMSDVATRGTFTEIDRVLPGEFDTLSNGQIVKNICTVTFCGGDKWDNVVKLAIYSDGTARIMSSKCASYRSDLDAYTRCFNLVNLFGLAVN